MISKAPFRLEDERKDEVMTTEKGTFLDLGRRAVDAGIAYAVEQGLKMAVVVIDVTGIVCASARMDGARTITHEVALAKANTAREFENSTSALKELVKPENKIALGQILPRIAFLGGGLPIVQDGRLIGALGASGGSEQEDVECAEVSLKAALS
jgi:uncharacterized protein GlcG (DUF336 family)